MKRKITLFYSFIGILVFIVGCKKGNTDTPTEPVYLPYSIKTYSNGTFSDSSTYKYDASNRIIEIITLSGTDKKYNYDSNGNLTELDTYTNGTLSSKSVYANGANSITDTYSLYNNGSVFHVSTANISLDGNQRITKVDNGSNNYFLYTYDSMGNTATCAQYETSVTTGPYYFYTNTFDSNKSPFLNVKGIYNLSTDFNLGNNNCVKEVINSVNSPNAPYTFNFTYIYNAAGYPTSSTETSTGITSSPLTNVYTYIIK